MDARCPVLPQQALTYRHGLAIVREEAEQATPGR